MGIEFVLLGCAAALVAALLPAEEEKQKLFTVIFAVSVVIASYSIVFYKQKIDRVANIEIKAATMIQDQNRKYTKLGFIHATLALLEKNKDLYPESYQRAIKMCIAYQCDSPHANFSEMGQLAFAMSGILAGLK